MSIEFTQYLMPLGTPQKQWIDDMPDDVEAKAAAIAAAGYRFEMELLSDYRTVSFTIADPRLEEDVAIEVCENGPAVPDAIAKMVRGFVLD